MLQTTLYSNCTVSMLQLNTVTTLTSNKITISTILYKITQISRNTIILQSTIEELRYLANESLR